MNLMHRLGGHYIRRAVRSFDIDIIRYDSRSLSWWRAQVFRRNHIGLVIDVGANVGQTGRHLRSEGYSGRIVSFEPSSGAFASLVIASRSDPRWHVERAALGSHDGTVILNVSGNSQSSSVLRMLDRHVRCAPESVYVQTEPVPLRRMDSFRETLALTTEPSLLKLDVQGYEDRVLEGATETLVAVRAIECELSLASLYEGQPSMSRMVETLRELGFVLVALHPAFSDPRTGELLQLNGMFVRN
jgi:FkbM family methyltransferase